MKKYLHAQSKIIPSIGTILDNGIIARNIANIDLRTLVGSYLSSNVREDSFYQSL